MVCSGAVDTVVNLGAGLDTRPYRLDLPATMQWIEVDQSEVITFKTQQLEGQTPRCSLSRHAANLADSNERRAVLTQVCAEGKVLVLTEGVIPYLSNDDVAALAEDLHAQRTVVGWIAEFFSAQALVYRAKRMKAATENAPFQFHPEDWLAFFAAHGWRQKQVRYLPVEGQRLGRPFPAPLFMRAMIGLARLFGKRGADSAFMKTMGYVLFAPAARH